MVSTVTSTGFHTSGPTTYAKSAPLHRPPADGAMPTRCRALRTSKGCVRIPFKRSSRVQHIPKGIHFRIICCQSLQIQVLADNLSEKISFVPLGWGTNCSSIMTCVSRREQRRRREQGRRREPRERERDVNKEEGKRKEYRHVHLHRLDDCRRRRRKYRELSRHRCQQCPSSTLIHPFPVLHISFSFSLFSHALTQTQEKGKKKGRDNKSQSTLQSHSPQMRGQSLKHQLAIHSTTSSSSSSTTTTCCHVRTGRYHSHN